MSNKRDVSRASSYRFTFLLPPAGLHAGLLGLKVFGVDGGEIMGAVQIAMIAGLPYTALREAVLTHPTLLEGLVVLFSSVRQNE